MEKARGTAGRGAFFVHGAYRPGVSQALRVVITGYAGNCYQRLRTSAAGRRRIGDRRRQETLLVDPSRLPPHPPQVPLLGAGAWAKHLPGEAAQVGGNSTWHATSKGTARSWYEGAISTDQPLLYLRRRFGDTSEGAIVEGGCHRHARDPGRSCARLTLVDGTLRRTRSRISPMTPKSHPGRQRNCACTAAEFWATRWPIRCRFRAGSSGGTHHGRQVHQIE